MQASLVSWSPYEIAPENRLVLMTTVGEDNEFEFDNLPLGVYLVRVVGGGRTSVNSVGLTLTEPDKHVSVGHAYTIAPITGRVTDSAGTPLENASVMIVQWNDPAAAQTNEWQYIAGSETKTTAKGGFVFDYTGTGPRAPLKYRVLARKEGYAPLVSEWIEGGRDGVELRMSRGERLVGRAVDGRIGEPVGGLALEIASEVRWDRRTFTTAADGRFELENVGPYAYAARTSGTTDIISERTSRLDFTAERPAEVVMEVVPGGAVSGRVYHAETGRGYANLTIFLHEPGVKLNNNFFIAHNIRQAFRKTLTDSDGAFTFDGVAPGEYQVERENIPGFSKLEGIRAPQRIAQATVSSDTPHAKIEFAIVPGRFARGRVVDADGRPVRDALVVAFEASGRALPPAWSGLGPEEAVEWAFSDAGGQFWLSGLKSGTAYFIEAERDRPFLMPNAVVSHQVGPYDAGENTIEVTIRMQPESRISATVVDAVGRTVPGARVHASPTDRLVRAHYRAAAPNGVATVDKLVSGTYELYVDVPSQGGRQVGPLARVTVGVGEHVEAPRLVVQEPEGLVFTGRVTDTAGRPVSGARVSVAGWSGQTRDDGSFRIPGVEVRGDYINLHVEHEDFTPYTEQEFELTNVPKHIQLRGKGTIVADVLHNGRPVEEFHVVRLGDTRFRTYASRTLAGYKNHFGAIEGSNGSFNYRVPEGDCTIVVVAEGYAPVMQIATGVVENQTVRLPPFNLAKGGILAGTVLKSDGTPAAAAVISPDQKQNPNAIQANSRGEFELTSLPTGTFELWISAPGGPAQQYEASVTAGQTMQQTFRLHGGSTLSGLVTLAGRPAVGAKVQVEPVDYIDNPREGRREIETDGRGRYSVDNLEDGMLRIEVMHGDKPNQRGALRTVDVGGGDYVLDIAFATGSAGIRGKVVDSSGRAVAGELSVVVIDPDELGQLTNTRALQGDAIAIEFIGSYDISGLPEGMCIIQVSVPNSTGGALMMMESAQLQANEVTVKDIIVE